jgi:hypothetical protein
MQQRSNAEIRTPSILIIALDSCRLGNDAFAKQSFDEAITHYSEAIRLDGNNAVYYSNRRCVSFMMLTMLNCR